MLVTDPVADVLTRIRNGLLARHQVVQVPHSSLKQEVVRVLTEEGYVRKFKIVPGEPRDQIKILLKYTPEGDSVIHGLERISRPGRRVYTNKKEVPVVFGGLGIAILSTSQGVMSGHQARKDGVGGEVLCRVW